MARGLFLQGYRHPELYLFKCELIQIPVVFTQLTRVSALTSEGLQHGKVMFTHSVPEENKSLSLCSSKELCVPQLLSLLTQMPHNLGRTGRWLRVQITNCSTRAVPTPLGFGFFPGVTLWSEDSPSGPWHL